jgi:hypothetical protein
VVANREQAIAAFQQFKGETCVLEQKLALDYEVSVVLARDETGSVTSFPLAENSHRKGILDVSLVPARGRPNCAPRPPHSPPGSPIGSLYRHPGRRVLRRRGELVINEMAPRPHNSGHYTIDACITSQYEQQVRALCGLPLGEARAHSAAAMVNLLGDLWYETTLAGHHYREPDWSKLHAFPPQAASLWQASRPSRSQDGTLHRARCRPGTCPASRDGRARRDRNRRCAPENNDIDHAVALLQAGELVAFPTETVYGLGADAANPAAVARIFTAKGGRPITR